MTYGEPGRGHPAWSLGEDDARPLIQHALNAGINFFDTANMYSQGSSEEILGREAFDDAFRTYTAAWAFKHPSPADFFKAMEDASGKRLVTLAGNESRIFNLYDKFEDLVGMAADLNLVPLTEDERKRHFVD